MSCIQSGYKTVTPSEVGKCLDALAAKDISYRAFRVFFGCLAMIAIREAATRSAKKRRRTPQLPKYCIGELAALTALSEVIVRRELRALERASLLEFTERRISVTGAAGSDFSATAEILAGKRSRHRPIPIPRSVLRFLARSQKPALGRTVLAYMVRGMSIDRNSGEVRGVGTVKASWIANVVGISLRGAKAARKELIAIGLISKDTGSVQRKLNRDGAYFRLNLAWRGKKGGAEGRTPRVIKPRHQPLSRIAPRATKSVALFAPPNKEEKTPYGSKNQKAWPTKPPGVCAIQAKGRGPRLRDVQMEDLLAFPRTEALYRQAVAARWVRDSQASFLNWVGAAVRAKTCQARDPVRVFLGIVKRGLWSYVTDADEERARRAINRYRYGIYEALA
ncbi:MAG TPA: hypothetical protein VH592_03030 [Gemmataceae bacterium]|jgi:hypothetical protein